MKALLLLLLSFLLLTESEAQIFKKIGNTRKEDAEWRTRRKAGQKMDQGLDTLMKAPNKVIDKKKSKKTKTPAGEEQTSNSGTKGSNNSKSPNTAMNASATKEGDLTPQDG